MSSSYWRTRRPLPVVLLIAVFVAPAMSAILGLGVLSNGDPAGITAEVHVNFKALALNDAGTAVFAGPISGPLGQDEGVWTFATGAASSTLVAREGDLAPGGGGATFGSGLSGTYPNIGSGGHVAFMDNLAGPAGEGVYRTTPAGMLEEVAQVGDAAPGGGIFLHVNRSGVNGPVPLNGSGDVVVHGQLDEPPGQADREGIWIGTPNALSLVVRQNDAAPGFVSFSQIGDEPMISDTHVAFDSTMNTGGTPSSATAIWTSPIAAPANIALVASNSALGASSIELLGINNAEEVVIRANFSGGVVVLMAGAAGSLVEAVRVGDAAPGTASTFTNFGVAAIGGNGDIVFRGVLASPVNGNGLWHWQASSGTIRLIAFGTGAAPGGGVFSASSFGVAGVEACLSATGKVGFRTTLDTGEAGIWFGDPRLASGAPGAVALVVRDGLPAPVPGPGVDVRNLDFFQQGSSTVYSIAAPEDGVPSGCNGMDEFVFRYDPPNTGGGGPRHLQVATPTFYQQVVKIPDVNADNIDDLALLRRAPFIAEVRDGFTGGSLSEVPFLSDKFTPLSIAPLPDTDGDGVAEIAVLALRNKDARVMVEIRNALDADAKRQIYFAEGHTALAMAVVEDDADNDGVPEIAVLLKRNSDGRGRVEVKNAIGPKNTQVIWAANGYDVLDVEVVDDADNNGVPEIAIMSRRVSDDRIVVQTKNAVGTANPKSIFFMAGHTAIDLVAVGDKEANGIPEIAVLSSRDSDGRNVVEIKNAAGAKLPVARWFSAGHTALGVKAVADGDGDTVPEVAVLSSRDSDGRILVEVKNAAGAAKPNQVWYSPGFTVRDFSIVDDADGNNIPEAGVLMIRNSDGRILVQGRNTSGPAAAKNYWFEP